MDEQPQGKRPVRSFVLREGKFTPGQRRALERHWPAWGLDMPLSGTPADWFGREAPLCVEIGFGIGEALQHFAQQRPDWNHLGIEVHRPGIGVLFLKLEEAGVNNVRVLRHDAIEIIRDVLPDASIDALRIFFPDPWPKKRHHKRRLVQPSFLDLALPKLKPGATLHLATDWAPYAEEMIELLDSRTELENTADGFVERPDSRPETRFERRGVKLGHDVFDLVYRKR
jgi:tRNA (guanine-N7-)-methyltransferase